MRFIKHETLTYGHKTVGVKWLFEHATSHQLLVTVDTYALRKPNRFIPPSVSGQCKTKTTNKNDYTNYKKVIKISP